jgi:uncharacterized protein YcfJ
MMKIKIVFSAAFALAVSACASQPLGPSVTVLPGPDKPFSKFTEDDVVCRDFANKQVAGTADQVNGAVVNSAVVGTILGAALGAAVGRGPGAAVGAASGALIGTGTAANGSAWSQMSIQQRYNIAYMQCMYAHGNQVPGYTVTALPSPPPYPSPTYPPPYPPPPQ